MKKRVIYLAGPIAGMPEKNYPLFNEVTRQLREAGHRVYNPAEFPENGTGDFDLRKAFAMYSSFICLEADALVLLPGWRNSSGSTIEHDLARMCRIAIFEWEYDWHILGCVEYLTKGEVT